MAERDLHMLTRKEGVVRETIKEGTTPYYEEAGIRELDRRLKKFADAIRNKNNRSSPWHRLRARRASRLNPR